MTQPTALQQFANDQLINQFKEQSMGNYVAHELEDVADGTLYLVTLQKSDGNTPLHQLETTREKLSTLEARFTQIQAASASLPQNASLDELRMFANTLKHLTKK
ncbi:hypothetical protein [Shewanella colwelliana]|uniref:hypothetical protein n=1 Tax=Shewanella colwelliana TaxID=23 RepID=UPI0022AED47C|nr:hypothetical protein [Shewanella colwelliana]MCZ4337727.1 hypothetical protein [Shewanella colwelliana]